MARRLTAILAADVLGYSKLMEEDEEATLAALKTHRLDLFDPLTAEHAAGHRRCYDLPVTHFARTP